MKKAEEFATANPDKISQIVAHSRAAMLEERNEQNRGQIEQHINKWVAKETEMFDELFIRRERRMIRLAEQGRYRDAYYVGVTFPTPRIPRATCH